MRFTEAFKIKIGITPDKVKAFGDYVVQQMQNDPLFASKTGQPLVWGAAYNDFNFEVLAGAQNLPPALGPIQVYLRWKPNSLDPNPESAMIRAKAGSIWESEKVPFNTTYSQGPDADIILQYIRDFTNSLAASREEREKKGEEFKKKFIVDFNEIFGFYPQLEDTGPRSLVTKTVTYKDVNFYVHLDASSTFKTFTGTIDFDTGDLLSTRVSSAPYEAVLKHLREAKSNIESLKAVNTYGQEFLDKLSQAINAGTPFIVSAATLLNGNAFRVVAAGASDSGVTARVYGELSYNEEISSSSGEHIFECSNLKVSVEEATQEFDFVFGTLAIIRKVVITIKELYAKIQGQAISQHEPLADSNQQAMLNLINKVKQKGNISKQELAGFFQKFKV